MAEDIPAPGRDLDGTDMSGPASPTVQPSAAGQGPPPDPDEREERADQHASHGSFLRELPFILLAALILSLLIKTFLVQAFYIPSGSMENTLLVGDRVFVNKLSQRFGEVQRGDIVVFRDPGGWLPPPASTEGAGGVRGAIRSVLEFVGLVPSDTGQDLIKRVIGVAGDDVTCNGQGRLTVNGKSLSEPYVFPGDPKCEPGSFHVKVPANRLWVMGDHRSVSEDSRVHIGEPGGGFVPKQDVIGRAFVVVWPIDRVQRLSRPDTFERVNAG